MYICDYPQGKYISLSNAHQPLADNTNCDIIEHHLLRTDDDILKYITDIPLDNIEEKEVIKYC